jgi:hypothetical protein
LLDGMRCHNLEDCKHGHHCIRQVGITFQNQCQRHPYKNGYKVCVESYFKRRILFVNSKSSFMIHSNFMSCDYSALKTRIVAANSVKK